MVFIAGEIFGSLPGVLQGKLDFDFSMFKTETTTQPGKLYFLF